MVALALVPFASFPSPRLFRSRNQNGNGPGNETSPLSGAPYKHPWEYNENSAVYRCSGINKRINSSSINHRVFK